LRVMKDPCSLPYWQWCKQYPSSLLYFWEWWKILAAYHTEWCKNINIHYQILRTMWWYSYNLPQF